MRDFIILHYHLSERPEPFWQRCRNMTIPDSLAERIALFAEGAQAYQDTHDLFRVSSWVQVMLGQRLKPRGRHHLARMMTTEQLSGALGGIRSGVDSAVARLPTHQAFLDSYCREAAPGPTA